MKPLKYTVAALALIAVASFTQSAMAAANQGDLVLGVYDTNTPGLGSFELDLGAFNTVTAGTNETWNLGTAVESTFSSDSSANLQFNIFAAANAGAVSEGLLAKQIAFTTGSVSSSYNNSNQTAYTNIQAVDAAYGSSSQTAVTTPAGGAFVAAQGAGSFQTAIQNGAGTNGNYGASSSVTSYLAAFPSDSTDFTLYTRSSTPNSAAPVAVGTFVFSENAQGQDILTFDPTAAPEPSAYALGLCAVALFLVLRRRSSVA